MSNTSTAVVGIEKSVTQSFLFSREELDNITSDLTVERTLEEDIQTRKVEPFTTDPIGDFMSSALSVIKKGG